MTMILIKDDFEMRKILNKRKLQEWNLITTIEVFNNSLNFKNIYLFFLPRRIYDSVLSGLALAVANLS